jgi:hypothetical protein
VRMAEYQEAVNLEMVIFRGGRDRCRDSIHCLTRNCVNVEN